MNKNILQILLGLMLTTSPLLSLALLPEREGEPYVRHCKILQVQAQARASVESDNRTMNLPKGIEQRTEDGKPIPLGIFHRFFGGNDDIGTTTPRDTSAPVILAVRIDADESDAKMRWFTNERATGYVKYGTTTALGSTTPIDDAGFRHKHTLAGLAPDTFYYYSIVATDAAGNVSETAVASFRTETDDEADTTSPRIVFSIATNIGTRDARVICG